MRFSDASWLDPVRFGSVPRLVPAGSEIKRFCSAGSVRPVRFGFLFLSVLSRGVETRFVSTGFARVYDSTRAANHVLYECLCVRACVLCMPEV